MPKVFISHSNQDSDETLFVADSLKQAGIDVWVDYENIRGGADWLCEIEAGIQRCDAVVIVLSKASATSVWVERECLYAWQLGKPVFTALIAEILIPLHLINIQYCDLRDRRVEAMAKLVESIQNALLADEIAAQHSISAVSSRPIEANFFPYVEQLPNGDIATLVARDLFHWARDIADEVAFGGGVKKPAFHARIKLDRQLVTIFSIWAYRRKPSAQIPLDYLARHKPFKRRRARSNVLRQFNLLLPKSRRFKSGMSDRRLSIPLQHLHSANKLEDFKEILLNLIRDLRANGQSR
ncbi:MAG: toll/interleukin-1 receptor domain-containing protein [Chloroflexota bacterium]|nr:toll/interleukin-1 receptor domain-containing protein [Chloroflexota bacterium]